MKNVFFLFLVNYTTFIIGQTYTFDKAIKCTYNSVGWINLKKTYISNSNESSYSLHVVKRNEKKTGILYDATFSKVHFFDVKNSEFKYKHTTLITKYREDNVSSYKFNELGKNKLEFTAFDVNKKRIIKYKMKIKKSETNYFKLISNQILSELYSDRNIKVPFNFKISKLTGYMNGGDRFSLKIDKITDVNISITIPKEENIIIF